MQFKLGLIVNPVAGLGGSVALKGSDGEDTAAKAIALGAEPKSNSRTKAALEVLVPHQSNITIYTVNDEMGSKQQKRWALIRKWFIKVTHPQPVTILRLQLVYYSYKVLI